MRGKSLKKMFKKTLHFDAIKRKYEIFLHIFWFTIVFIAAALASNKLKQTLTA